MVGRKRDVVGRRERRERENREKEGCREIGVNGEVDRVREGQKLIARVGGGGGRERHKEKKVR